MNWVPERRRGQRIAIPGRPGGRIHATLDARVLDLSSSGVRIEHYNLLRPGFACTLELPAAMGGPNLPVRVVRSVVVGSEETPAGERLLRYESGLAFVNLSGEQQESLETILKGLTPGGSLGDGRLRF
jgi:hypothetical protein